MGPLFIPYLGHGGFHHGPRWCFCRGNLDSYALPYIESTSKLKKKVNPQIKDHNYIKFSNRNYTISLVSGIEAKHVFQKSERSTQ